MTTTSTPRRRSKLDLAIKASLGAMLAMNLFVLMQQVEAAPSLASSQAAAAATQQA
jgi:hypothetical protein